MLISLTVRSLVLMISINVLASANKDNWSNTVDSRVKCVPVKCSCTCQSGFQTDENGCRTCLCKDLCECHQCPPGMQCDSAIVACDGPPCPPSFAYCWKSDCPTFVCNLNCENDFELDKRQCPLCKCHEPCSSLKRCPPGFSCQYNTSRDCSYNNSKQCTAASGTTAGQCVRACCPRAIQGTGKIQRGTGKTRKMPKCASDKQCKAPDRKCCADFSGRPVCTQAIPCGN